jgi:hypothetical protein
LIKNKLKAFKVTPNNVYFAGFALLHSHNFRNQDLKRFLNIIFFLVLPLCLFKIQAQETERFFQVSGIISDEENNPLPNVGVVSIKLKRGTISERTGIYSITSTPGDTIFYRALGFKRKLVILPDDFTGRHYSLDVKLGIDTIPIDNVVVLPWKSYSEFIKDMSTPAPLGPEIENMNRNIASIEEAISTTVDVKITPEAGYRYAMQQQFRNNITKGQYPINNLLNPFAWSKFINGLQHGLLKNQDTPAKPAKVKQKKQKRRNKSGKE